MKLCKLSDEDKGADFILGAPTGISARNIGGQTLHSLWGLPVEKDKKTKLKYEALNDIVLSQFQAMYQSGLGHIIDEVSMVSNELYLIISMRMSEIFNEPDKEFGGMPIIVFGDLLQLEPVQADPPFVTIE